MNFFQDDENADLWDDSALIKAYDQAINTIKVKVTSSCQCFLKDYWPVKSFKKTCSFEVTDVLFIQMYPRFYLYAVIGV